MEKLVIFLRSWKTTLLGLLPFLVALANYTGLVQIQPDEFYEAFGNAFDGLILFFGSIIALIGVFAKDGDKSSNQLKIK